MHKQFLHTKPALNGLQNAPAAAPALGGIKNKAEVPARRCLGCFPIPGVLARELVA